MQGSEFWFPFLLGGLVAFCSVGLAGVMVYLHLAQPQRRRKAFQSEEA